MALHECNTLVAPTITYFAHFPGWVAVQHMLNGRGDHDMFDKCRPDSKDKQTQQVVAWAAQYNTWLLMRLAPKGVVFSCLVFSFSTTAGKPWL